MTAPTTILPTSAELCEIAAEVWSSFLDDALVESFDGSQLPTSGRVIGWVSIGGDWSGHLYVSTSTDGAHQIAAAMFELEPGDIGTGEIADAVGEIANVVGGSVKGMLGGTAVLSLPQVVLDAGALLSPDAQERVHVAAVWRGHPVEFALWERSSQGVGESA